MGRPEVMKTQNPLLQSTTGLSNIARSPIPYDPLKSSDEEEIFSPLAGEHNTRDKFQVKDIPNFGKALLGAQTSALTTSRTVDGISNVGGEVDKLKFGSD